LSSRAVSPALRFLPLRPVGTARWSGNASEDVDGDVDEEDEEDEDEDEEELIGAQIGRSEA
jgi:hypothetical protein